MGRFFTIVLLLVVVLSQPSFSQNNNWGWSCLRKLEANRSPSGEHFYKTVSALSDPIALGIPLSCLTVGVITKDKTLQQKGVYLVSSFTANAFATHLLKITINRKRPVETDPNFTTVVAAESRSFPSGHTSEAFSMATAVTLSFPKWYVAVPAYSFASLVGYSRMYLGVHYPSDVIAGAALGTLSAWSLHKANQWLQNKRKKNSKAISSHNGRRPTNYQGN